MKSLTIRMGEQDYDIKELTLGTLENLQEATLTNAGGLDANPRGEFTRNITILSAALVQDHPDLTPDILRSKRIGGTIQSVAKAVADVLRFAGFVTEPAEPPAGEAPPAAEG